MPDALQMLRDDHHLVKDLFKRFEDSDDRSEKALIVKQALDALDVHAELEEEIFYPAVRKEAAPADGQMDEAEEEHHVVKLLIGELRAMKPGAPRYDAKFTVLAENVKHHIDEEESEMLPKAAELGMQRMNELGAKMEARKLQLTASVRGKARPRAAAAPSTNGNRPAASRPRPATRRAAAGIRTGKSAAASTASGRAKPAAGSTTAKKTVKATATKRK